MTPQITAQYCELTWFRPWFHLVPHVGKNAKSQLTIGNWFGSWFGSTWFRSCEKECCEEPLPTMYWGSVGLMDRLRKQCLSFNHQHRKPNVNWISSLSESDRLEIQLKFGFGHWYSGKGNVLSGCWAKMTKKDNKFHCHLLQQHARLETRGPSTTLLNTTWTPCGPFAHVPFIIINAKRCVGSTLEGLLSGNSIESGSTSSPLGSTWVHWFVTPMGETSPLRVHSSPLGSTLWGTLWGN